RSRRERPKAGGAHRTARPSTPEAAGEDSAAGDVPKAPPRAARPRSVGGDRPVPRRDTRSYEERGPQDDAGPRRDDRPADNRPFDNRGSRRDDHPADNREPRQNDHPADN